MQDEAGATYIDCCASVPEEQEAETLKWMIDCIQEVSDLPISVDSQARRCLRRCFHTVKDRGLSILFPVREIRWTYCFL